MKHPKIAKAWSQGKSSVTGKKEGPAKNKNLPYHKAKAAILKKQKKDRVY